MPWPRSRRVSARGGCTGLEPTSTVRDTRSCTTTRTPGKRENSQADTAGWTSHNYLLVYSCITHKGNSQANTAGLTSYYYPSVYSCIKQRVSVQRKFTKKILQAWSLSIIHQYTQTLNRENLQANSAGLMFQYYQLVYPCSNTEDSSS